MDIRITHMEWTYLALALARNHKLVHCDKPTFRYYSNTPNSLSKSREHLLSTPMIWHRLERLYSGTPFESDIRKRLQLEYRSLALLHASEGNAGAALKAGWRSLDLATSPGAAFTLPIALATRWFKSTK
jgi:hypothetical protein